MAQKSDARIVAERRPSVAPGFIPENRKHDDAFHARLPAHGKGKSTRVETSYFLRAEARSYARSSLRDWRVRTQRGSAVAESILVPSTDGERIQAPSTR